jgi:hypothetical protein
MLIADPAVIEKTLFAAGENVPGVSVFMGHSRHSES